MDKKEICKQPNRVLASGRIFECQCESPGHCPVYNQTMGPTLHSKCQHSQGFRDTYLYMKRQQQAERPELQRQRRKKRAEEKKAGKQFDLAIEELKEEGISLNEIEASEGLGDTVEKVLSKFGITSKLIEKIAGIKECRCQERKKWLNKIFPYGNNKKETE